MQEGKIGKIKGKTQSMDIEVNASGALNISVALKQCRKQQEIPKSQARTAALTHTHTHSF